MAAAARQYGGYGALATFTLLEPDGSDEGIMTIWRRLSGFFTNIAAHEDLDFRVPDGLRVYAVGDIHGELALLDELLSRIAEDRTAGPDLDHQIIFLGDYIDRGPDARGVIDRLSALAGDRCYRFLKGNHEDAFLAILSGQTDDLPGWLRFGGRETLASYGIAERSVAMGGPFLRAQLVERVPPSHLAFLRGLEMSIGIGDYFFVHAGIRPGVDVAKQDEADLMWIRREFLSHEGRHSHMIVHGHTITSAVDIRHNRIGVDTGAYASGVLSAIVLEGSDRRIIDTRATGG